MGNCLCSQWSESKITVQTFYYIYNLVGNYFIFYCSVEDNQGSRHVILVVKYYNGVLSIETEDQDAIKAKSIILFCKNKVPFNEVRKVLKKYCKCTSNKDQNRKQFLVDVRNIYAEEFLVKGDAYNLWDNHLRVVDVDPDSGIESTIKGQKVCAVSGDYSNNLPSQKNKKSI